VHTVVDGVPVFGTPLPNAVAQAVRCRETAAHVALLADHHLGYSVPIGGVVAYDNAVSPSGVGYDIGCGNKAVRLDIPAAEVTARIEPIMDDIWRSISFGVGRKNADAPDHPLFHDDPAWSLDVVKRLRGLARSQLGTVGSGNHYVDLFVDEENAVWCGVHFGSRGLGHRLATHFLKAAGARDAIDAPPAVLSVDSALGQDYLAAMHLAGRYAYAGRDEVCDRGGNPRRPHRRGGPQSP
jgi:tRNA-splicing ligase RtcB